MVGMFSENLGSLSKKNHQTIVMDLHSVPSNSLFCFGDLFIYNGGPPAMVRFYLVLSASFCSLIDFRCDALPEVISWNGSSLNCLSASFSHLVLFLLSGLVPWSIPGLDGASGYACWASGCM